MICKARADDNGRAALWPARPAPGPLPARSGPRGRRADTWEGLPRAQGLPYKDPMAAQAHILPRLLTAVLLLLLALPPCAKGAGVLALNTAARAPRSLPDGGGPQDRIVKEAFRRIGEQVSIVNQPPERALINANEGALDGDCWRVEGQAERYPNLIMVPEPVDVATITAFTWDPELAVGTWEDLKPCNVAYINGWKVLDARVHDTRSLIKVKNIDSLFTLLARKRIDVALVDSLMGQAALRRMKLSGIRALTPPLTRPNMYIYLHKRHAELVPKLAQALRQMRRDGTMERLTKAGLAGAAQ
jgi:polar amino acid transport system substrate-binding protein